MSANERIRDKYPIFDAYGSEHEFLEDAVAVDATRDDRIKSVWPFIVGRVLAFSETLTTRELVNFDPEDILAELWVVLAEKDLLWTPARGKYITFAGVVIEHELHAIRDRARTIHSPRNSSCRMKQYRKEEGEGTITERKAKTFADIRRTGGETKAVGEGEHASASLVDEPLSVLARAESAAADLDAVKRAVRRLRPFEALVVGRLCGLWGRPPSSVWLLAWETGRDQTEVRRANDRAKLKIRKYLSAIKHPVTAC